MNHSFFEEIHTFSSFWKQHQYCLSKDCVEKGIRLLSTSTPSFRSQYSCFFLTKLLNAFCSFEQKILQQRKSFPQNRGLFFRFFKIQQSENSSLGIAACIQLNGNTEFLSQERLLQTILHFIPGVISAPHKSYQYRDDEAGLLFIYQEIEKKRGRGFSLHDIGQLKRFLPREIEANIECYSPSLFLIRNEEEIFRNIVQMSREFHKVGDLPQVTISFQEQTPKGGLLFSVVIVRLVTSTTPSLKELSQLLPTTIQLIPEMTSEIGALDKEHFKQANITIFEVNSALFALKNSSIDLREVRLYVAKALELMIGEYRDYNGGAFSKQHKHLRAIVENDTCTIPKQERKVLRINFIEGDPLSLNPQIGLDLRCRSLQKALFEGLTRINPSGSPQLAAAKSVSISSDGLTYLFTLKKLQWSNGEKLSAFQFEKSWKKAICTHACLRPDFFYVLQNARKAHFKQVAIDEIGVKALDAQTLQVTLEYPAPYFLEMLSHPLFFPFFEVSGEPYVFCGPFTLLSWQRHQSIVLIRNPYYWDFENVKLEGIKISIIRDPHLAFEKYDKGELDWIGSPFCALPPEIAMEIQQRLHYIDRPGVAWLYCNLAHPLFSSAKVRKAFAVSLDRDLLCKKALPKATPLKTHLPQEISLLEPKEVYSAPDQKNALILFEEGLRETGCPVHTLSDLRLLHSNIPGQKELAMEIQRQWQDIFGIQIHRVEETWNSFSHQLDNRLIHFGTCNRHPYYKHPMYFLQIFYEATNIHNAFGWHSDTFNDLIDQARAFPDNTSYLKQAELELLEQMPVIPIHGVNYNYLLRSYVQGIYFCQSGDVDFKWISFKEE